MDIQFRETKNGGVFFVEEDHTEIAKISYVDSGPSKIIIDSTDTDPAYRGRGIAQKLVEHLAGYAVSKGWEVIPVCPYAKNVLERHPEYLAPKK